MKRGRRTFVILFITILLCITCIVCPPKNRSAEAENVSNLTFTLINDGQEYKVGAANKSITSAVIPSLYQGLPVTEISDNGFAACTSLEYVFIPESIQKIGNNAFIRDVNLKKVVGMAGVTSFGNNAFSMCSGLDYLILPSNIQQLGNSVIRDIPSTVYVRSTEAKMVALNPNWKYDGNVIYGNDLVFEEFISSEGEVGYEIAEWQLLEPSGSLTIYSWCYADYNDLVGAKLLNIASCAFWGLTLDSITIKHPDGSNLTHAINIEPYAFAFSSIQSIDILTDITVNVNDSGYVIGGEGLFAESSVVSVTLPDTLTEIANNMFSQCCNLTEIKNTNNNIKTNCLSDKIITIGDDAFYGCIGINSLSIEFTIQMISQNAFNGWGLTQSVYIDVNESASTSWNSLWNNGANCEFIFKTQYFLDFAENEYVYYKNIDNTILNSQTIEVTYNDSFSFRVDCKAGYENATICYGEETIEPNSEGVYTIIVTESNLQFSVVAGLVQYSITYKNLGGGVLPSSNPTSYTIKQTISLLAPTWYGAYLDSTLSINGWNPGESIGDVEITVEYGRAVEHTFLIDNDGGSGDERGSALFNSNMPTNILKPERYDYKFLGYYSESNGLQYYDANMNSVRLFDFTTDNETFIARWEKEYFYVSFEQRSVAVSGGTTQLRLKNGERWPSITMPLRTGYVFSGYYYQYEVASHLYYDSNGMPQYTYFNFNQDIVLYGYWEQSINYYIYLDKIHYMEGESHYLASYVLGYDDSITYTAPESMTYYVDGANDVRLFSRWVMIKGDYVAGQNEWQTCSESRDLDVKICDLISTHYPEYDGETITIRAVYGIANNEDACLAAGTLITLANGSQKAVEELTDDDILLVWNMHTGTFDVAPILFIDSEPIKNYEVINLYFSDGTNVKVITEHAFWDYDLNKYVYLRKDAAKYIGHWFNKLSIDGSDGYVSVRIQLINVVVQEEQTSAWSPVTYGHLCYYVNGMLSMPGGISGLINIFDVDAQTLQYDTTAMQNDIAIYGLYTYEEFAEIVPITEEIFNAFNGQYLKVSIEKGLITIERVQELVERYSKFLSKI